ncbi:hypothetical protein BT93_I1694 [Corymbia citriodora subsp. variegata]|nr:hypothetical protein BT93_I1694 [Corymbia citriodora subsp. variegata]
MCDSRATYEQLTCDTRATHVRPMCDSRATHVRPTCDSRATHERPTCDSRATHVRLTYDLGATQEFGRWLRDGAIAVVMPKLVAASNAVAFANPKAPVYPCLAQGKEWNEMTVTWTSGYGIAEAEPFVYWSSHVTSLSSTLARFIQQILYCLEKMDHKFPTYPLFRILGAPARTVGWRDPGFIHTSFLKELWPNCNYVKPRCHFIHYLLCLVFRYYYRLGHELLNGSYIWSQNYRFRASPYPGQNSLQRAVIFGDMGKAEADGSNEYHNRELASLNTTYQLSKDLENIDIVFHIGDISYAVGYLSQWDQFTEQVEPIASSVPYMIASGNHERDWPGSGSFYGNLDSGGECGVVAEAMFYFPVENRAKFWYSTDYGMFRFCIADTELDWREGTEQYNFIEHCLASVHRQRQPWLVFLAHWVLGYSSSKFYAEEGSFGEPMGRESLQKLGQKYKVDIAIYGHVHNYERICPIYQNECTNEEKNHYKGALNGTIHIVAGGGGFNLTEFTNLQTKWSLFRDYDYGFVKLTAFDYSNLLFEYKKSSDGKVYDSFRISRDYRDILACTVDSSPSTTLAS